MNNKGFDYTFSGATDGKKEQNKDKNNDEEGYRQDRMWKLKGFEIFIGGGIYFGSKKTANYYNGAPKNTINLHLLTENQYRWLDVKTVISEALNYVSINDSILLREDYNYNSGYNIAMDVAVGARYRFLKNWYIELSYSFRRLTCQNRFIFDFPEKPGSFENPPYSHWESIVAKEDRHYIDLSVGYILHRHPIAKPFISVGALFTFINIRSFDAVIEGKRFDMMAMARNPNYIPNVQPESNYKVWNGVGYGFTLSAGLKIAVHSTVSLDPVFQLSVASFGNNKNLPMFNTSLCFNYMAGVRIVINDALFFKK